MLTAFSPTDTVTCEGDLPARASISLFMGS
jgi:hypothetical protein